MIVLCSSALFLFAEEKTFRVIEDAIAKGMDIIRQNRIIILVCRDKKVMTDVAISIGNKFKRTKHFEDMLEWSDTGFRICRDKGSECVIFDGCLTGKSGCGKVMKLSEMSDIFARIYDARDYFSFIITVKLSVWNARKARFQRSSLFHESHILTFQIESGADNY